MPSNISCANPATNQSGNASVLLASVVKPNPASLGPRLRRGQDARCSQHPRALPLSDFNVTTQRGKYITARCHDANKQLNTKGKFIYSDGQSDTVGSAKACKVG